MVSEYQIHTEPMLGLDHVIIWHDMVWVDRPQLEQLFHVPKTKIMRMLQHMKQGGWNMEDHSEVFYVVKQRSTPTMDAPQEWTYQVLHYDIHVIKEMLKAHPSEDAQAFVKWSEEA